jgi:hypothetical protein
MKRLIDGVTYNTETAALIAKSDYEGDWNNESCHIDGALYQTRGGAFFIVEYISYWDSDLEDEVHKTRFKKCSDKDAREWINTGVVEVILNPFEDKIDEDETVGTVYVRLPAALKRKIESAAEAGGLSANSWAMRCFEKCLPDEERQAAPVRAEP